MKYHLAVRSWVSGNGRRKMTLKRAVLFVVASTLIGAGAGVVIGLVLGRTMPGYYRSIFPGGHEPGFDPVAVGIGQGLAQGLAGGAVVGVLLVAIVAWHDVRTSSR